jgi:putative ABC transport system permease protein
MHGDVQGADRHLGALDLGQPAGQPTSQVTVPEQIPGKMGTGVAMLQYQGPGTVDQPFDPSGGTGTGDGGTPIPGWVENGSAFDNAEAISSLTGTTAVAYAEESVTTRRNDRRLSLSSLALDVRAGIEDKVILTSGRLPERAGEVLVSQVGEDHGLPTSGTMTLRAGQTETVVEVVGTADVISDASWMQHDLVTPEPFVVGQPGGGWILVDDEPVTWSEVRELNRHGLVVWSAEVLRNPPPRDSEFIALR